MILRGCVANNMMRRAAVMLLGNFFIGVGTALFKVSLTGTGPCVALILAISERSGVGYSSVFLVCCAFFLALEFLFGRNFIGLGTLVNWLGVGFVSEYFINLLERSEAVPDNFAAHLLLMLVGVLALSLGCSMYQTSNLGIAPYDSMSIIISGRFRYRYFWCRMFTDALCVGAALLLGGIVGLGTLMCVLGIGPFISFFNVHISERLCGLR